MSFERQQIEEKYKWNKAAMYASEKAWEKALGQMQKSADWQKLAGYQNKLGENSAVLKAALDLFFQMSRTINCLKVYANLWLDEDLANDQAKEAFVRINSLSYDFVERTSWIDPELIAIAPEQMDKYLSDPLLQEYRFYLEKRLRWKPHTLALGEEKLLAKVRKALDAPSKTFKALYGIDTAFEPVEDQTGQSHPVTYGSYYVFMKSRDRVLRQRAFESLHGGFEKVQNTLAELFSGHVQKHIFNAKARKFKSSLESALYPHKIDLAVYANLLATVKAHRKVLERFVRLKKRLLNLDQLHVYDLAVPMVENVDFQMDIEEAKKTVIASVAPLGEAYQKILQRGLTEERWADYLESKNKRSGAYSSGCYDSYPYILLNYHGTLNDALTLAHEAGHSMQSELINKTQPYVYSVYSIFVAEIASTFNEQLF
ncbi:MAG: M3 family oligoendopeptidase, partial [Parachlamydiales bacterium]